MKIILLMILKNITDSLKRELNNELLNLEDSVSTHKEKYEKLFEKSLLDINKRKLGIEKVLELIK